MRESCNRRSDGQTDACAGLTDSFTHLFDFFAQLLVDELDERVHVPLSAVLLGRVQLVALLEELERRVAGHVVLGAQGRLDGAVDVGDDGLFGVALGLVLLGQLVPRRVQALAVTAPESIIIDNEIRNSQSQNKGIK